MDIAHAHAIIRDSGFGRVDDIIITAAQLLKDKPFKPQFMLSQSERDFLKSGGALGVDAEASAGHIDFSPLVSAAVELGELIHESRSLSEVACTLGLTKSRVSQLMTEKSMFTFCHNNQTYYPHWQFRNIADRPRLKGVLEVIGNDIHPLDVNRFFTTGTPELVIGDQELSPAEWIANGGNSDLVIQLESVL